MGVQSLDILDVGLQSLDILDVGLQSLDILDVGVQSLDINFPSRAIFIGEATSQVLTAQALLLSEPGKLHSPLQFPSR